jgi:hypothetical protein
VIATQRTVEIVKDYLTSWVLGEPFEIKHKKQVITDLFFGSIEGKLLRILEFDGVQ